MNSVRSAGEDHPRATDGLASDCRSPGARRSHILWVFFLSWTAFSLLVNDRSLLGYTLPPAVIEAIVERHTFSMHESRAFMPFTLAAPDDSRHVFNDFSYFRGQILPAKQPGYFVLGSVVYWPLYALGLSFSEDYLLVTRLITIFTGCLFAALGTAAFFCLVACVWSCSLGTAYVAAACYALGTLILPFSGAIHQDVIAGALVAGALLLAEAQRTRAVTRWPWAAGTGLVLGLAVFVSMLPVAVVLATLAYAGLVLPRRALPALCVGFVLGVAPLLAYNDIHFGSPLLQAYGLTDWPDARPRFDPSWMRSMFWNYLGGGTLTALRYMPLLYVGVLGAALLEQPLVTRLTLGLTPLAHVVFLSTLGTVGHCQYGPRYLLVIIPHALLGIVVALEWSRRRVVVFVVLAMLIGYSVVVNMIGSLGGSIYCYTSRFGAAQYLRRPDLGNVFGWAAGVAMAFAALAIAGLWRSRGGWFGRPPAPRVRIAAATCLLGALGVGVEAMARVRYPSVCQEGASLGEPPDGFGWKDKSGVNPDGLRDDPHPLQALPSVPRVAVMGTDASGLADWGWDTNFVGHLDHLINGEVKRIELFNASLPGWTLYELKEAYARSLRKYRPELIVLALSVRELAGLLPPPCDGSLRQRVGLVRALTAPISHPPDTARGEAERFPAKALVGDELDRIRAEVGGDAAQLLLLVIPARGEIDRGGSDLVPHRELAELAARHEIPLLDLRSAFDGKPEALGTDSRLTSAGALRAARELARPLTALIPSGSEAPSRARAISVLARDSPPSSGITAALATALRTDEEPLVRWTAAAALASPEHAAPLAFGALRDALFDHAQPVRWRAAQSIARRGDVDRRLLPAALRLLEDEDPYLRGFACYALGRLSGDAAEAVPALLRAVDLPGGLSRDGAAVVLSGMPSALAQAAVTARLRAAARAALQSRDSMRQRQGARLLARLGPAAEPEVPLLIKALEAEDDRVKLYALEALAAVGEKAAAAMPAVRGLLDFPRERVRRAARATLARLGPSPGR